MTEWTKHPGRKDPPIPLNTKVEVMFGDGDTAIGVAGDWDHNWQWREEHANIPGIIIAYRIIKDND